MLKIQITNLTDGQHEYRFIETPGQVGLGDDQRFQAELEIDLRLEKSPGRIRTSLRVQTRADFQCDRCLDAFQLPVDQEVSTIYLEDSGSTLRGKEEEIKYLSGAETLDLTEDVHDALLLGLPMKMICRDECGGLCPHCGVNRNRETCNCEPGPPDPRWDRLREIANKF